MEIPLDKAIGTGPLAGAVPLDSPLLQVIGGFRTAMATHGGVAVFCIGLTKGGGVLISNVNPGGQLEALGMLCKAALMVGGELGGKTQETPEGDKASEG